MPRRKPLKLKLLPPPAQPDSPSNRESDEGDRNSVEQLIDRRSEQEEADPLAAITKKLIFRKGDLFAGKFVLVCRVGFDDSVGATYFGVEKRTGKEAVIRINLLDDLEGMENAVVNELEFWKTEATSKIPSDIFGQFISGGPAGQWIYTAVRYRGGPSMRETWEFKKRSFGYGTVGRIGIDLLETVHYLHLMGYILRSCDMEMWHFDAHCRHFFLSDLSQLSNGGEDRDWIGGPQYAPISWNDPGDSNDATGMGMTDDYEAILYLLIELANGSLPWGHLTRELIGEFKKRMVANGRLFDSLPHDFSRYFTLLVATRQAISHGNNEDDENELFQALIKIMEKVFKEVGHVSSWDDHFDFEREPIGDEKNARYDRLVREVNEKMLSEFASEKEFDTEAIPKQAKGKTAKKSTGKGKSGRR